MAGNGTINWALKSNTSHLPGCGARQLLNRPGEQFFKGTI